MNPVEQLQVLLVCNVALLAVAAFMLWRFQRTIKLNKALLESSAASGADSRDDRDAALCGFLDHRLALMQARLDVLAVAPMPVKADAPVATSSRAEGTMPFDYAVRITQHGASVEDVMQACGLNRAEASLIKRIHGAAKSAEQGAAA